VRKKEKPAAPSAAFVAALNEQLAMSTFAHTRSEPTQEPTQEPKPKPRSKRRKDAKP